MAIIPKHAVATADTGGNAVFMFPDVPQGELWSGTTSIPLAPPGAVSQVTASGELLGAMYGPGAYGPWTCDHSQRLAISSVGLTPSTQYSAVWHADDKGHDFSTYPAPITPTVTGSVSVPTPLPVSQSGPWTVASTQSGAWLVTVGGTVTATPSLAISAFNGVVTMTGAAITLPSFTPVQGVVLGARSTNTASLFYGQPGFLTAANGTELRPGEKTVLLPVRNLNLWAVIGTSGDVASWIVT